MKKLNALNLGKSLKREEMKSITGGIRYDGGEVQTCTCGTHGTATPVATGCNCACYCDGFTQGC